MKTAQRRSKGGTTTGRPSSRSSFLGNPDAKFSAENSARPQKAEKSPKRNSGFVVAWQMIPPLRGGDFQGITGLSSDDSFSVAGMRANGRKPHAPPVETGLKTASPSKTRFFIPSHRPGSCHQMQRLLQVAISPYYCVESLSHEKEHL